MNKAQSEFHDDLSQIAMIARGYVVREVYEKWKDVIGKDKEVKE